MTVEAALLSGGLPDLSEVRGQETAKRALEVAVAGGHHLLMIGPPGSGKTMLAERVPSLLPPLADHEAAEVAGIYARRRDLPPPSSHRPFRRPPPGTTRAALIGGRRGATPGEVSLAHQGVLVLDELPLFRREALDALRGPLEQGQVTLSRLGGSRSFPARFLLIATMNASSRRRALSAAVLDRIDLIVSVPRVSLKELRCYAGEGSETVALRILAARAFQLHRCGCLNASLGPAAFRFHCRLDAAGRALLDRAVEKLGVSARSVTAVLKVARTLADLEGSSSIRTAHLAEAIDHKGSVSLLTFG